MDKEKNLPIINFDKVSKIYPGGIIALDEVSFIVDPGEFTFIVGPSGAGKSTAIRLLIKEEFPTQGSIQFQDINVTSIPRKLLSIYRQQLGVVFQDLKLIESKTVSENVEFALEITNRKDSEIAETTNYLLDIVNLKGRAHLFPQELSGGEKQRVAIARALANDPKLFIADEPTGNLDPENAREIMNILQAINEWGTTVIVITHDDVIVDKMQKRVLRMNQGKIVGDEKGGSYKPQVSTEKKPSFLKRLNEKASTDDDTNDREIDIHKREDNQFINQIVKRDKKLARRLEKENLNTVEKLLDMTEEDFKRMGLKKDQLEVLEDVVKNNLKE
ncbi:MAG: Cell division ATP-binding protein FtsE [candidate division WS6 bacterium GW2011_GWF2_39_15]|uniref:Cell division ATP-binding protein FtsE n=1 Tax=candidate division WS6 bacterium GW2011_GWF2_39_15 TaxID=1619100 RepID=A0A0G0MZJ2_9BACT|nr:MAG: Cell division ATP-binding protein FtsE [candidate division WS6 bacterium GW2011_GWF2_39_15]